MSAARSALVVGGGIVGLVVSRALALRGLDVTLLERKPAIEDEGGIGIGIQNNAMNALAEIGVAERIVAKGVPIETIEIHAPNGEKVNERPTDRYCGSIWPGYTGISRTEFHSALVDAAVDAGVTLRTKADVAEADAETGSITLADGSVLQADLLVGADGIYSKLRKQLFPEAGRAIPTGEAVWRARIPGIRRDRITMMFGAGVGTIGITPLTRDTYLYVVDRHDDRAPPRGATDLADRLFRLIGHVPGFPGELARHLSPQSGDVTYRPLETVRLTPPWHRGRTILIGDAAHAGPPTLAQGAAMGIEDGVVLAQCLASGVDVPEAFDAFMARRWMRVSTIVDASVTISRAQMEPGGQARMAAAGRDAAAMLALPY